MPAADLGRPAAHLGTALPFDGGLRSPRRRLRVAIIAPSLRTLGGQAVQAQRLVDAWRGDADVDATLVPVDPPLHPAVDGLLTRQPLRTAAAELAYLPSLTREARHADVLHVFSRAYRWFLLASFPAIAAGRLLGRPVLLHHHNGEAGDHLRRSRLARASLKRVSRIVVPSAYLAQVLAGFGFRAAIVPNIIDVSRFTFRMRDRPAPRLLSTRNLHPLYDVGTTLRAFQLVQREYPEASLTVLGRGSQEAALRALVQALGVRHVTFRGRVPPEAMPAIYADHDIYIQSPTVDNAPNSIVEAFVSGLPVVTTAAGGVTALTRGDELAHVAAIGDHLGLAARVFAALRYPQLASAMAAAARESCAAYEWPAVRRQWLEVYAALTAARCSLADARGSTPRVHVSRPVEAGLQAGPRRT